MKLFHIAIVVLLYFGSAGTLQAGLPKEAPALSRNDSMLNREWIGPDGAYLEIKGIAAFLSVGYRHRKTFIEIKDTLLNMNKSYAYAPDHDRASPSDEYFRVLQLSEDTMVLKPVNQNARKLFNMRGRVMFVSRRHLAALPLNFKALEYTCDGAGMTRSAVAMQSRGIRLKIDSSGRIQYKGFVMAIKQQGYFTGRLSNAQMDTFMFVLKNSALERFKMPSVFAALDGVTYTYRIQYNGKVLEDGGSIFPYFGVDLRDFLGRIYQEVTLERGNDDAEIE